MEAKNKDFQSKIGQNLKTFKWELYTSKEQSYVAGQVSCGNHYAISCLECPQGNGAGWCNGQCMWLNEECTSKGNLWLSL